MKMINPEDLKLKLSLILRRFLLQFKRPITQLRWVGEGDMRYEIIEKQLFGV